MTPKELSKLIIFHTFNLRRVWRYQWGNQNPYIEEEQTTQWQNKKVQKDKQRSTKHTHKTTDRVTRTTLKTRVDSGTPEGWAPLVLNYWIIDCQNTMNIFECGFIVCISFLDLLYKHCLLSVKTKIGRRTQLFYPGCRWPVEKCTILLTNILSMKLTSCLCFHLLCLSSSMRMLLLFVGGSIYFWWTVLYCLSFIDTISRLV